MTETALSLSNFSLSLPGKVLLDDVTLSIEAGRVALIYGPRGSGKSALMRSFTHLNEEIFDGVTSSGSISFFGKNVMDIDRKCMRQRAAYVDTTFLEALSNFALLDFFRFLKGKHFRFEDFSDSELDLMDELGLLDLLVLKSNTSLKTIALSKKVKLLIFSTLTRKPEVIMLDNVLDHLDDEVCTEVKNILLEMRKKLTIIISSRLALRLMDIADLLIVLKSGKILYEGSPELFVLHNL